MAHVATRLRGEPKLQLQPVNPLPFPKEAMHQGDEPESFLEPDTVIGHASNDTITEIFNNEATLQQGKEAVLKPDGVVIPVTAHTSNDTITHSTVSFRMWDGMG